MFAGIAHRSTSHLLCLHRDWHNIINFFKVILLKMGKGRINNIIYNAENKNGS